MNTITINQIANGPDSDNIGRDKHVNHYHSGISIDDFFSVAKDVYYSINKSSFDEAESQLKANIAISSNSVGVSQALNILHLYLDAKKTLTVQDSDIQQVTEALDSQSPQFVDFYAAILVELTILYYNNKDQTEALEVYGSCSNDASIYLKHVYIRYFANESELDNEFQKISVLTKIRLLFLARGLYRIGRLESAGVVLDKIKDQDANLYIIKLNIQFDLLTDKLGPPIAYLEDSVARRFQSIAFEFINLIQDKTELTKMSAILLTNLIQFAHFDIPELNQAALKFITDITSVNLDVANLVEKSLKPLSQIPQELINKINNPQPLTLNEAGKIFFDINSKAIPLTKIKKWLNECAVIEDDNQFSKNLAILIFKSFVLKDDIDHSKILPFSDDLSQLLEHDESHFKSISPSVLLMLCKNLKAFKIEQSLNMHRLLSKVVHKDSPFSELYFYYIESLMNLQQYQTLGEILEPLEPDANINLLIFRAKYYELTGDFIKSKNDYLNILEHVNDNIEIWYNYLDLILKHKEVPAKNVVTEIPEHIFQPKAANIFALIQLIYERIDFVYARKILVKLFLMDPSFVAPYLHRIELHAISNRVPTAVEQEIEYDDIHAGVVYEQEGKRKQKLIVSDEVSHSPHFISIESSLATTLLEMSVEEERLEGMYKIKLVENQPIFTTIFQIASEIDQDNQHNSAQSLIFSFQATEGKVVEDITEVMQRFSREKEQIQRLIEDPQIPMYMKGLYIGRNEEIKTALTLLENRQANSHLLRPFGNFTVKDSVLLDVYSFVFLSLNDNYKGLIASKLEVFLSQESLNIISQWISDITHESYFSLSLSEQNEAVKTDASTVKAFLGPFITRVQEFLGYVKVIQPNKIDLPYYVSEIRRYLTPSAFSTLKLSIANDIPWLCLDHGIASLLSQEENVKLVKLHEFLSLILPFLEFDSRKMLLQQYSAFGLTCCYFYQDLIDLAYSNNSKDWELLKDLLNTLNLNLKDDQELLKFLSIISKLAIIHSHMNTDSSERDLLKGIIQACGKLGLQIQK